MEKYELQKLRGLPIEGVAERLGLRVKRHKCLCPFHDDHHASMSFKVSRNTFRCFVCGASGGTIDLVMKYLNKDFKEACRWLGGESAQRGRFSLCTSTQREPSPACAFDASRFERYFERPWLNDEARRFLFEERRLDPRVVRWCRLTSWKDRQGTPWLQTPYYDREGRLVGVQNRNLSLPQSGEVGGGFTFHMYPDRDAPGERLFLQLKEVLPHLVHHQLPPGCKDFGDYYLSDEKFRQAELPP